MAQIAPLADFCHECGAPVTSLATMDPIKRIYAQGWVYRRVVARPTSPIMFWGVWLIFGPTMLINLGGFLVFLGGMGPARSGGLLGLQILVWLGFLILHASILFLATKRYLHLRSIPIGHCMACGYNLHGLPEPRCPECGTPFNPEDLEAGVAEEPGEYELEPGEEPDTEEPQGAPTPRADRAYAAILGFGWLMLGVALSFPTPAPNPGVPERVQICLGQIGAVVIFTMTIAGIALLVAPERKQRSPLFKCFFWFNLVPAMMLFTWVLDWLRKSGSPWLFDGG